VAERVLGSWQGDLKAKRHLSEDGRGFGTPTARSARSPKRLTTGTGPPV
jgi:hypothetical protein